MSRHRSILLGLVATLCCQLSCAQYSANMFLNGEYHNGIKAQPNKFYSVNPASNIFLEHAIISRQASPFQGPTYLPPEENLKCGSGQQCVLIEQCQNGYFTQQLQKIQACKPSAHVCCTYRPPPTTTTERPYDTCQKDYDCVPPHYCNNGEIDSPEYIQKSTPSRCYAPDVCCRMPTTTLTVTGYLFRTPERPFVIPTRPVSPTPRVTPAPTPRPTTPRPVYTQPTTPRREYLPPSSPAPTTPRREYIPPSTPAPTPRQPVTQRPTPPPYRPQPTTPGRDYLPPDTTPRQTPPPYRPQPTTPAPYRPQPTTPAPYRPQPTTPAPYRPQPTTPAPYRPQPTTPAPYRPQPQPTTPAPYRPQPTPGRDYLPPDHRRPESSNTITRTERPYSPRQPTQPRPTPPRRGEDQLSPRIFPNINIDRSHLSKCASALECTPENMCNSIGVIMDQPVELTPMEAAFRVPLTDCVLENGAPGKCCRDANYVDPWPINLAGVCATRNSKTSPKGIQEFDANFGEIPWQVMILKESTKTLVGGGAIIGDQIVLTAASVVKGLAVNDVKIKAGEWELGRESEPLAFQIVGAKSIDIHPEYDPSTGSNDMAVITLDRRLEFAQHIKPICVTNEDPKPGEKCVTTGWGRQALSIHEEGAIMHVTDTNPVARSECGADETSVCSATVYDSCQFDVGSALACGNGNSVMLKGVYAAETGCGDGQVVRFSKPDLKWVNAFAVQQNKAKLLKRRV